MSVLLYPEHWEGWVCREPAARSGLCREVPVYLQKVFNQAADLIDEHPKGFYFSQYVLGAWRGVLFRFDLIRFGVVG